MSADVVPDPEVIALMTALVTAEDEGTAPPDVTVDASIGISRHFHAQADRGMDMLPDIARQLDVSIACGRGCNGCCHEMVMVRGPEAADVVRWLDAPERLPQRRAFLRQYPAWRSAVGDAPERLTTLLRTGPQEAYDEAHRAQWRKAVLCAFNHEGECLIYPVRPIACRAAHAVQTAEHCHPASPAGEQPQRIAFVPLDDLVQLSRRVMRAADRAARGPTAGHESLVKVVAAALLSRGD